MKFEDNFSAQSKQYAQFRPQYPDVLYEYLASLAPKRSLVWDCGTGNGQAAVSLAKYFWWVYATDASAEQIAHARLHERVEYHVEPAEQVGLETGGADLVTVAQALHWFDFDKFYTEVKRVLKPNGFLAVWTYGLPEISPRVDDAIKRIYFDVLSGFWPERIRYVEEQYRTLPFPFEEVTPPVFAMETTWDRNQLMGFLDSWSATQKFRQQKGRHPLEGVWDNVVDDWQDEIEKRLVHWNLHFRIGRKS